MDEPTISLDQIHKKQFWEMLKIVVGQSKAGVLISTHDI